VNFTIAFISKKIVGVVIGFKSVGSVVKGHICSLNIVSQNRPLDDI